MADYYPLLSRAVSALPASTPESRRAIYDRAGKALLGQLKAIQPPIPQADIEREEKALREAIDRIEAELAPALTPQAAAAAAVEKALMELGMPGSDPAPAAAPAGPAAPRPPGTPGVAVRPPPSAPGRPQESPPDDLDHPVRPAGPVVTATAPKAQRPGATSGRLESGRSKKSAVMLFGGLGLIIAVVAGGIGFYAWKTRLTPDQMRQGRATATAPTATPAPAPSAVATPEPAPASTPKPAPPRIETRATNRVPQNGQAEPASPEPSAPPAAPAEPAPRAPTQSAAVEPAPQQAGIPVAQRAAILMAAPTQENPQNVQTYIGTVVWRTDTITRGPGQPAANAVRADIDIPDAKFSAVMTIEKNTDATLPASHTVTWRFTRADDSPIPEIAETDTMQMRDETSPQVDPLLGARARITTNIFIIALASGDAATKRNVDLMEKKGWFDLPVRTSDNRLAKITLEKGSPGEKIMLEALARWAN